MGGADIRGDCRECEDLVSGSADWRGGSAGKGDSICSVTIPGLAGVETALQIIELPLPNPNPHNNNPNLPIPQQLTPQPTQPVLHHRILPVPLPHNQTHRLLNHNLSVSLLLRLPRRMDSQPISIIRLETRPHSLPVPRRNALRRSHPTLPTRNNEE
jgi:hypothetical protein